MSKLLKQNCCKTIYGRGMGFSGGSCSRPATVEVAGKWYCAIHSPDGVAKRTAANEARWAKEDEARKAHSQQQKINARMLAASWDLLQAAQLACLTFKRSEASGNFLGDDDHEAWTALNKAIAKALGG